MRTTDSDLEKIRRDFLGAAAGLSVTIVTGTSIAAQDKYGIAGRAAPESDKLIAFLNQRTPKTS